MNRTLIAFIIAAVSGGAAAPAFAMTEGEYRTQKMRLKEEYSFRFVDCNAFSGKEKRDCASKIRSERDAALDKLEQSYRNNKQG